MARSLAATFSAIDALPAWLWSKFPVRAHSVVMGLFFGTAIAVGYALLPDDSERIAMLERDGKMLEARQLLELEFASGDRRQRTLFQLQGQYETSGNLVKARQMLELLAERRPRDVAIQRQLGQFYKQTQDEQAYIKSLLQQIDLRYSETACREVIGLLRRSGAYTGEQDALQKCRQKGYRKPDDMVRLASLLATNGDVKEASVLLRAVDDLRRLKTERERLQLFELLIENEQPNEAQRRGVRWIKGTKDDGLALKLIYSLVVANRHDLAIELARETSVPGDSVFLAIAEVMVQRNETTAAQAILRGWLDKAVEIEPPVAARYITAAIAAGSPELALSGAQRMGLAKLPEDSVNELAAALEGSGRRDDATALRASMGRDPGGEQRPIPRKIAQGFRLVGLDGWRQSLWKRLGEENTPVVQTPAVSTAAVKNKSSKELNALKRARKASSVRPRYKPTKPPDNSSNLFQKP